MSRRKVSTTPHYEARYAAGEKVQVLVSRSGGEPGFDRACEQAYRQALDLFGCDEDGHLHYVRDSCRSTDTVVVEFARCRHYGNVGGQECVYEFVAWVERAEDATDA